MIYWGNVEMKNIRKVIIIGCPGSGKSTFARALHEKSGLPLFHLDMMYWNADRTVVAKDVFLGRLQEVLQKERWIIDGNYGSTMELRMAACDAVFFLDYPLEVCLAGVAARRGQARPDIPWVEPVDGELDEEFMTLIQRFEQDHRPRILELLEKYVDKEIIVFRSREEAQAYLAPIEEAIARVERMEYLLDEITEGLRLEQEGGVVFDFGQWKEKIHELTAYYESGLWMQDYRRDEQGYFPVDLKRGVLSEDAVYDLLTELDERR